ncbi:MAG: Wzz/FepE/Etk N-terminal domain-containing protein [Candidatus Pelethousia sp.]|nr:Wzz/FepE/Etk N-terminal domain-containing protein [Candidatus Pelethousia sp.]
MMEVTIRDVLKIIRRRIWLIVLLPFMAVVTTTLLVYYVIVPVYTATASMYVLNKQNAESVINYSDLQSSALLTADYRELILSKRVLRTVSDAYGLDNEDMQKDFRIAVTSANNTRVLEISVTSSDPVLAANLANAIGKEFSTIVVEIMDANNVNFVDIAEPPVEPSAPRKLMTIAVAGVTALLLAIGISVLLEMLNTTIRTTDDVERALGLSVLACIPHVEVK